MSLFPDCLPCLPLATVVPCSRRLVCPEDRIGKDVQGLIEAWKMDRRSASAVESFLALESAVKFVACVCVFFSGYKVFSFFWCVFNPCLGLKLLSDFNRFA